MYAALMLLSVQYIFSAPNSSSPGCSRSACVIAARAEGVEQGAGRAQSSVAFKRRNLSQDWMTVKDGRRTLGTHPRSALLAACKTLAFAAQKLAVRVLCGDLDAGKSLTATNCCRALRWKHPFGGSHLLVLPAPWHPSNANAQIIADLVCTRSHGLHDEQRERHARARIDPSRVVVHRGRGLRRDLRP